MNNKVKGSSPWLFSFLLLRGWVAKYQHKSRKYKFRQVKKFSVDLIVFHDIADIAGADPKALGSGYGVFGQRWLRLLPQEENLRDRGFLGSQPAILKA